ncbi:MAG: DNA translocase FtsK 4TM domain-containing protein [Desulfurellaceae bacterium]|nr:DNA translocase FtsK 4TM domain-containing protein [Desulfurellaceae bacterium]
MARHTQSGQRSLGYEIGGVALIAVAIFFGLALLSYQPDRPQTNLVGIIGYLLADLLCSALGKMGYALPALAVYTAGLQFRLWRCTAATSQAVSLGVFGLASTALLSLWYADRSAVYAGGWIGGWLAVSLRTGLNQLGAYLVLIPVLVVSLMGISRLSLHALGCRLLIGGRFVGDWCGVGLRPLAAGLRPLATTLWSGLHRLPAVIPSRRQGHVAEAETYADLEPRFVASETQAHTPPPAKKAASRQARKPAKDQAPPVQEQAPPPIIINRPPPPAASKAGRSRSAARPSPATVLDDEKPYRLPGLDLLDPPLESRLKVDEAALHASSQVLESKLNDFGVKGKVVAVRPGPVITTYEFEPAPGVKVNRVVSLADDLQMALRAVSVRILAPIPGKAVVGIEVSNPNREKVYLREILDSPGFQQTESPLGLALGKDSIGNPIVADLARMPHLLVAGATGTGKSVSLNAMIMSLLYRASPRDVRFIMIDPKMLELSLYENLPHQLSHVITNPKEAGAALQEVVRRMEYRYKLLRDKGARNISAYNRSLEHGAPSPNGVIKLTEVVEDELGEDAAGPGRADLAAPAPAADSHDDAMVHQRLPYLVVIVDELADLMLTVGREIEEPITRLAQMGRASGIHLILATQRPSVDVITGLIKANFPARVSFQVSSRIDSRTILDAAGAERLLGAGDMLFLPPGSAKSQRIHGAFVSEPEISKAVGAIKKQAKPVFDSELVSALEKARSTKSLEAADDDTQDEMYEQARELVIESRQASISWVQRRLRVGYNRAARMIERMEREGLIAPAAEAGKPREVLVEAATVEE